MSGSHWAVDHTGTSLCSVLNPGRVAGWAGILGHSSEPGRGQGGVKAGSTVPGIQYAHRIQSRKLFWLHALDVNVQDSLPESWPLIF